MLRYQLSSNFNDKHKENRKYPTAASNSREINRHAQCTLNLKRRYKTRTFAVKYYTRHTVLELKFGVSIFPAQLFK
jgi:SRSO17 transposase